MNKFKRSIAVCGAIAIASCSFALAACGGDSQSTEKRQETIDSVTTATNNATYNSANITRSIAINAENSFNLTVNGKIDLTNFDADMEVGMKTGEMTEYGYIYIRDKQGFASSDSYATKPAASDMVLDTIDPVSALLSELSLDVNTKGVAMLLTLANSYDAITISDSSITLNLVTMTKGIFDDVTEVVDSLTDQTTISQIYSNDIFKNVLNAANKLMDADQAYALVVYLLTGGTSTENVPLPAPAEGQSIYDYIGSLLTNVQLAEDMGLTSAIGDQSLVGLINAMNNTTSITAEMIKTQFNQIVSEYISFGDDGMTIVLARYSEEGVNGQGEVVSSTSYDTTLTISEAQITYNLNGDKALTSEQFSLGIIIVNGQDNSTIGIDADVSINFSDATTQVSNIGSAQVVTGYDSTTGQDTTMSMEDYLASVNG